MLTAQLVKAVQPANVMAGGLLLSAAGFAVLSQADSLGTIVAGSVVFALGLSPVAAVATDLIVGSAPPEKAGAASAMSETGAEFGGALGIAVLGSIGTAIYRSQIEDAVPADVPAGAADAARESLGGAVAAGESLPAPLAGDLVDAAASAFTAGFQAAALTGAVVTAAAAALCVLVLGRRRAEQPALTPQPERA
jgi:DHA2 family multidrug resistance protein-like MFS transporter